MTARVLRQSGAGRLGLRQTKAISKTGFWFKFEVDLAQSKRTRPAHTGLCGFFSAHHHDEEQNDNDADKGPEDLEIGRNEHAFEIAAVVRAVA